MATPETQREKFDKLEQMLRKWYDDICTIERIRDDDGDFIVLRLGNPKFKRQSVYKGDQRGDDYGSKKKSTIIFKSGKGKRHQ